MKRSAIKSYSIPYYIANGFLFCIYFFFIIGVFNVQMSISIDESLLQNTFLLPFYGLMNGFYPFAFLFIFLSCVYLYRFKLKKTFIFGIIGNILYALTIPYFMIAYNYYIFLSNENIEILLRSAYIYYIIFWLSVLIINFITLSLLKYKVGNRDYYQEKIEIRKVILDFGMKFTRLEIKEISEKSEYSSDLITEVLKKMIENEEINAEFYRSTNAVSFDQQANIKEIDMLMAKFNEWESEFKNEYREDIN